MSIKQTVILTPPHFALFPPLRMTGGVNIPSQVKASELYIPYINATKNENRASQRETGAHITTSKKRLKYTNLYIRC